MSDLDRWRAHLDEVRHELRGAEEDATRIRWALAHADEALVGALRDGDSAAVSDAERDRREAERELLDEVRRATGLRGRLVGELAERVDRVRDLLEGDGEVELDGVDASIPIALLPVRLETRFDGPPDAPVMKVRIYPDDAHIDDHEPALSSEEAAYGRAYWTTLTDGGAEPEAWAVLTARLGPHRALWVREQLQPLDGGFPEVPLRAPGTSRPAVARALPDLFLVRVRAGTWSDIVPGRTVADTLQVGLDLSGVTPPPTAAVPDPTELGEDDVVTLGEETRWLSDFDTAVAAGMGVVVPLPSGTGVVDEVAVTGVCLSLTPDDGAALVEELVARHRVTHGAGFVAPGTPTNNLADSTSGWLSRPDPSRLDPTTRLPVPDDANAPLLAAALGLSAGSLDGLVAAEDRDAAEAESMARALFEATWGPYLRTHAQPGFPLALLPQVHTHVTRWVKGGGPLPTVRLGRQPYGVLPVQPRRPWRAAADDGTFTTWLAAYLPRIRALWLSGRGAAPSGVASYTHEPVSTRFRVRTANASLTHPFLSSLLLGGDSQATGIQERRLVAELGLGDVLPMVVSQRFVPEPVNLWMPMSDDADLDFRLADPEPKQATSVLGLLLRNAQLQLTSNLADELLGTVTDADLVGIAASRTPTFRLPELSDVAVSSTPEVTVGGPSMLADKLVLRTVDGAGVETTVQDRIREIVEAPGPVAEAGRYLHRDAFRTFRSTHQDLAGLSSETRARLAGEVLDCASHRYDAWVTSLATKRLMQLRENRASGLQLGAWGVVQGVRRRDLPAVEGRADLPTGTVRDAANRGFVPAPSLQHADVAAVLRAAWLAHDGPAGDATGPFAVDLRSHRLREALALTDGMRNGQQLGALLGYVLERSLHDASGRNDTEVDWAVFVLRRIFPLRVATAEDAGLPSERLVVDGWRVAQEAMRDSGAGLPSLVAQVMGEIPGGLDEAAARAAITAALEGLVGVLDGLMDLGLAEAMHQLAGADFARAAAATDMVGRAGVPPDAFDVAVTPRSGQGVDQRLVVVVGDGDRPAGFASETPRALLAPFADAFVARRLGPVTDVGVRLLDVSGAQVASCALADLGLSALDLAADAASAGGASPFPLLLARAGTVTGHEEATALGLDPDLDEDLLDLLEHAARWHQALAGRRPLSHGTFRPRGLDPDPDRPDDSADGGALTAVLELADLLESEHGGGLSPGRQVLWGLDPPGRGPAVEAEVERRVAAARAAGDAGTAARALLGGDCVVTGTVALTGNAPWTSSQRALGVDRGDLVGWIQDTGRVRDAARALDEALLHDELRGVDPVAIAAGQSPDVAGAVGPGDPPSVRTAARRWVGAATGTPLGRQPVVSFVALDDQDTPAAAAVTGVEVDAWVEVVPDRGGAGAVAANLASPDSRAPNTILVAVPSDLDAPWTQESLFSVIDEAMELAECRLVDLDASRRVPAVLPAIYISEFDEGQKWRELLHERVHFPERYLRKGEL